MKTTKKIVISAMLAALVCVATMIIKIPSPLEGYINLGDCVVLLSGWLLSPLYGFLTASIGSALADILSPYALYAPATFVIKGTMAIIAYYVFKLVAKKLVRKKSYDIFSRIASGIAAEMIMILGYYIFEGFLYGFGPSAINIPANAVQGTAGVIFGIVLVKIFEKSKIISKF